VSLDAKRDSASPADRDSGYQADPIQQHLLRAALDTAGGAIAHFRRWESQVDLVGEVDPGTYRLMPLLYSTLQSQGCTDALMGRLKGTYRRAWCETQPRRALARELLTLLHGAGIPTLLTKGMPLGLEYYPALALRPMGDIDVVVPHARAREAIALLDAAGWARGATARDDDLEFHHAMQFFRPGGGEIDLHWSVMLECQSRQTNDEFWSRAQPLQVEGIATLQLEQTDLLFHTIIHGVAWNELPGIRWIADASMILRHTERPIDWTRLLALARREHLSVRLGLGLSYLAERFEQPIPAWVLQALQTTPVTLVERIENTIAFRDPDPLYRHPLIKNWVIFARYCRIHHDRSTLGFLDGLSHFMRIKYQVDGRLQIPAVIARGIGRRMLQALPGRHLAPTPHDD
jgi:hypothetical protein